MDTIKIVTIGGQNEIGKNCLFIETKDSIYIFNAGMKIPIDSTLGVAYIHADFSYLARHVKKIKGIFVGTSSFSNVGALSYLLKKLNKDIPIYTHIVGESTIQTYFERKFKVLAIEPNIKICENLFPIEFVDVSIIPVKVTNYLPCSYAWVIKTKLGNIVIVEDFIVNNDKTLGFNSYLSQINHLCKGNVLVLLTSPGIVDKNLGYTTPNHKCFDFYNNIISKADGRVIISLNDYNGYAVNTIATIAKKLSKSFIIYSTTFMNVFSTIVKNKLFNAKGLISLPVSQINNSPNAIIILIEPDDTIYKKTIEILNNQMNNFTIRENDTFVLGTTLVPGYEMEAAHLMDQVNRLDLKNYIIPKTILDLKASNEDHKYLIDLLKPKYVVAISGLYMELYKYYRLITSSFSNYSDANVFIPLNGDAIVIEDNNVTLVHKYIHELSDSFISQSGNIDSNISIIKERKQLANSGIIFVSVYYSKANKCLLNKIDIKSFGVSSLDNDSEIVSEIYNKFNSSLTKYLKFDAQNNIVVKDTKVLLKKGLLRIFERKINKKPIILPNFIEVL